MPTAGERTARRETLVAALLGWPLLLSVWAYFFYFLWQIIPLFTQPIVHSGVSRIDVRWLWLLLPVMVVPTFVVFSYLNWLGWKFFQHN